MEQPQTTSMIDTGSKTMMQPAGLDSSARPMSYDALSMAAPSRISSRTVRQDGRHGGRHLLYHCQDREATNCRCAGMATRMGRHKNELNPEKKPTLIACMGSATCQAC